MNSIEATKYYADLNASKVGKRKKPKPPENKYYLTRTEYEENPPQPKVIIPFPELRQTFDYDCGCTSDQQYLVKYGYEIREDNLMKLLGTVSTDIEEHGTDISAIVKVNEKFGLKMVVKTKMTIKDLHDLIDKDIPIIVLLQAWSEKDKPDYKISNKDGHYVTAIGYNDDYIFFEDPSSFVRTYRSNTELLDSWHDVSDDGKGKVEQLGIYCPDGKPVFQPNQFIHMD